MWATVKIPDVLYFQEGPGVRNSQYTTSGVKLLNVANLQDGKLDLSTSVRYISSNEAYGRYGHFLVDEGDLIIASSGIKIEYFDKKMGFVTKGHLPLCMNTSTIRFKSLDPLKLNIKYFMYFLKSFKFKYQIAKLITGSAQLNFGPSHLKQIDLPLPPIINQEDICRKLDIINEIILSRRKQLEELDNLIKSVFYDMFGDPIMNEKGWAIAPLNQTCTIVTGNTPSRADKSNFGDYIEWIKSDNINTASSFITQAEEKLSLKGYHKARFVDENVVLMTCIAGSINCIGNVAITNKRVAFNQQINAIIPEKYDVYFLYWLLLRSKKYIQSMVSQSLKGILSKSKLSELVFIVPSVELQNQFAAIVEKIEEQKALVQKALDESQYLFDSLMDKYFGE